PNEFDVTSTRFCAICKINVCIGTGGEANWDQHIKSNTHCKRADSRPSKNTIMNFFSKPKAVTASHASKILPPSRLKGTIHSTPIFTTEKTSNHQDPPHITAPEVVLPIFTPADNQTQAHSAILRIFHLSKELPTTVPIGMATDAWACFTSENISVQLPEYEGDIFMLANRTLHGVFGYDMGTEDLATLVRRGPFGVEAFCTWAITCMSNFKLSGGILEPRLERLEQALKSLYVFSNYFPVFSLFKLNKRDQMSKSTSSITHCSTWTNSDA
ncbi:hypothetical protein C0992_005993, partial [Termitomyces sp. T32_za158]